MSYLETAEKAIKDWVQSIKDEFKNAPKIDFDPTKLFIKGHESIGFAVLDDKPLTFFDLPDKEDLSIFDEIAQELDDEFHYQQVAAYYLWENAGRPEGRDLEFWLEAERQIYGCVLGELEEAYDYLLDALEHDGLDDYAQAEQDLIDGNFTLYTKEEFEKKFVKG